jgi:hypothetical protein
MSEEAIVARRVGRDLCFCSFDLKFTSGFCTGIDYLTWPARYWEMNASLGKGTRVF